MPSFEPGLFLEVLKKYEVTVAHVAPPYAPHNRDENGRANRTADDERGRLCCSSRTSPRLCVTYDAFDASDGSNPLWPTHLAHTR